MWGFSHFGWTDHFVFFIGMFFAQVCSVFFSWDVTATFIVICMFFCAGVCDCDFPRCAQLCKETFGGRSVCSCARGYTLAADKRTCLGER